MLVFSRAIGESGILVHPSMTWLITVLSIRSNDATFLITHAPPNAPGVLKAQKIDLSIDQMQKLNETTQLVLVDIREEKVRIGVNTTRDTQVHRLEVWQAIQREQKFLDDGDEGPAGSPVPA